MFRKQLYKILSWLIGQAMKEQDKAHNDEHSIIKVGVLYLKNRRTLELTQDITKALHVKFMIDWVTYLRLKKLYDNVSLRRIISISWKIETKNKVR